MKKTYIYMMLSALFIWGGISCTDGNDWDVDEAYAGIFRPMDLSVSPTVFSATLTWKAAKDAKSVIVEVNKEEFIGDEYNKNSLIFGEDKNLIKSPVTIDGLEEDTEYYIRIRAVGEDGKMSKWGYPKEDSPTFKTKVEQIFIGAPVVTSTSVKVTWDKSAETTHLVLTWKESGIEKEQRVELTDADKLAGTKEVEDLKENCSYTISIYNEAKERGRLNFKTFPKTPGLGTPYFLDGSENLAEFIAALPDKAVELIIPSGASYDLSAVELLIPTTLEHLTLWGLAGEEGQPMLKFKQIKLEEQANFRLHLFNLDITGTGAGEAYVINDDSNIGRVISEIIMEESSLKSFRGLVRLQKNKNIALNSLQIRSSLISDIGNFGVITLEENISAPMQEVIWEKSTFYNFASTASHFSSFNVKVNELTIKKCTFHDIIFSIERYFLNFVKINQPDNLMLENNIFSSSTELSVRATNPKITTPFVFDSYNTNEFKINSSYPFTGINSYAGKSTTLFEDPANGNFTIIDASFTYNAGDPRWRSN